MSRRIRIELGGLRFVAELLEDEAPETCEELLRALPIKGRVIQAR